MPVCVRVRILSEGFFFGKRKTFRLVERNEFYRRMVERILATVIGSRDLIKLVANEEFTGMRREKMRARGKTETERYEQIQAEGAEISKLKRTDTVEQSER